MAQQKQSDDKDDLSFIRGAPDYISTMLTYGSQEDWELGMEKMKRRAFLEEDMEHLLQKIEEQAKEKGKLAEWAKEVADRVADIKKLATNKDTSLYQATELLKQAEPSFSFICDVERSKFELKLESSAKLQSFDQTYKKQIEASLKDDVTDADKDKLTKEYKQQLDSAIQAAENDKRDFDAWDKKQRPLPKIEESTTNVKEIVDTEKKELKVISSYCGKDKGRIEQELDSLQKKVHEKEKSRLEEIEERKQKLDANAKRKKQLEDELSALKEDSKRLENEKIHLERSQRDSQQVYTDTKDKINKTKQRIEELEAKTKVALDIIGRMGDVARSIIEEARKKDEYLKSESSRMNKESLLQLRRSVVMEMFLCKKKIEDNTDSIQDNKAEVEKLKAEKKLYVKKGNKVQINRVSENIDTFKVDIDTMINELSEKSKIYKELEQKLQKAEKELQAKGVEPIDFDSKYTEFKKRFDEAYETGPKDITFLIN